ncbi:MAG TPA: nuclear transport factor 2 family protein [Thermoanaerobaculia bacterium]|nr:nuclear transport factor 2 family protein [Thermoanaerobaculia bacterium]
MSDHLATVQEIYEAFGRGDIPAILDRLADDVQWEPWADNSAQRAGVPWLQPRTGKAGVLEFFQIVGTLAVSDFRVLSLMAGGNQVAAEIEIATDRFRDQECHLWRFDAAGKVERMRHYVDTAKHTAAANRDR